MRSNFSILLGIPDIYGSVFCSCDFWFAVACSPRCVNIFERESSTLCLTIKLPSSVTILYPFSDLEIVIGGRCGRIWIEKLPLFSSTCDHGLLNDSSKRRKTSDVHQTKASLIKLSINDHVFTHPGLIFALNSFQTIITSGYIVPASQTTLTNEEIPNDNRTMPVHGLDNKLTSFMVTISRAKGVRRQHHIVLSAVLFDQMFFGGNQENRRQNLLGNAVLHASSDGSMHWWECDEDVTVNGDILEAVVLNYHSFLQLSEPIISILGVGDHLLMNSNTTKENQEKIDVNPCHGLLVVCVSGQCRLITTNSHHFKFSEHWNELKQERIQNQYNDSISCIDFEMGFKVKSVYGVADNVLFLSENGQVHTLDLTPGVCDSTSTCVFSPTPVLASSLPFPDTVTAMCLLDHSSSISSSSNLASCSFLFLFETGKLIGVSHGECFATGSSGWVTNTAHKELNIGLHGTAEGDGASADEGSFANGVIDVSIKAVNMPREPRTISSLLRYRLDKLKECSNLVAESTNLKNHELCTLRMLEQIVNLIARIRQAREVALQRSYENRFNEIKCQIQTKGFQHSVCILQEQVFEKLKPETSDSSSVTLEVKLLVDESTAHILSGGGWCYGASIINHSDNFSYRSYPITNFSKISSSLSSSSSSSSSTDKSLSYEWSQQISVDVSTSQTSCFMLAFNPSSYFQCRGESTSSLNATIALGNVRLGMLNTVLQQPLVKVEQTLAGLKRSTIALRKLSPSSSSSSSMSYLASSLLDSQNIKTNQTEHLSTVHVHSVQVDVCFSDTLSPHQAVRNILVSIGISSKGIQWKENAQNDDTSAAIMIGSQDLAVFCLSQNLVKGNALFTVSLSVHCTNPSHLITIHEALAAISEGGGGRGDEVGGVTGDGGFSTLSTNIDVEAARQALRQITKKSSKFEEIFEVWKSIRGANRLHLTI